MERWHDKDRAALEAAKDDALLDSFVDENRRFILRCASRTCRRFVTESDDEFEVALVAFVEAVRTYDAEAGSFAGFASLVIRRRLLDHFDKLHRRRVEIPAGSAMTWDEVAAPAGVVAEVQEAVARDSEAQARTVKDEIEAVGGILKGYGFSFFDIAEASPKSKKTKGCCARAVNWMLELPARIAKMRQRHTLPVMELSNACDLSHKVVDRHRRYIIAATEILDGDFPQLSEYLRYIKRDRA